MIRWHASVAGNVAWRGVAVTAQVLLLSSSYHMLSPCPQSNCFPETRLYSFCVSYGNVSRK